MTSSRIDPDWFGGFPGARFIGPEEECLVAEIVRSRSPYRYYGLDPRRACARLEARLAESFGVPHMLALSSGTAAVHAALAAAGVGAGDEVILPAYGWSADLMAVLAVGATPVMAAIDETLGLDPRALSACCSGKTRAVLAIHMRGLPCDVAVLAEETRRLGLPLIEDCAQCLGGTASGRLVGSFGGAAAYSFQYNKLITCGEGGALGAPDPELMKKAKRFHDLGMERELGMADPCGERAIEGFGLNYRMSELQAAMLLAQVEKLPAVLAGLRATYAAVDQALAPLRTEWGLKRREQAEGVEPNGAFYGLQGMSDTSLEPVVAALRKQGLPAQWCGAHDPHHFASWVNFLDREQRPYRLLGAGKSEAILRRSLFLELKPRGV